MANDLEKKLLALIDKMKDDYDWGGSDGPGGNLMPGEPDWDEAKKEIKELLNG